MKKIWILARSRILRNIYSSVVYVILSIILAFLCNTVFSLEDSFNASFAKAFNRTESADCAEVIPDSYYKAKEADIKKILTEDTDVSEYQVEDALLLLKTPLVHEREKKELSGSWMIRSSDRDVELSTISFVEKSEEIYDDPIYVPFICKSFFGFNLGDKISFRHNNKVLSYHVAGFTESILFGNRGTIAFELPDPAFKAMRTEFVTEDEISKIILIKSPNLSIHKKLVSLFKDIAYINYVDRNSATLSMNSSIAVYRYIMVFFAIINTIIVALVIKYKIKSSILKGYKNIGVLKALGYKSGEISAAYMLQYLLLSILGYIIGIALSSKFYSGLFKNITAEIGFQWESSVNFKNLILFFVISICVIGALTFLSTIKTRKISPVRALRGEIDDYSSSKVSVTRGILYPNFIIAWKLFYNRRKQNILLILIISLSMLAASFFLTLYYNVVLGKNRLGLQQISGMENFSIVLQLKENEDIEQWIEKIKGVAGVKQTVKAIGPGGSVLYCDDKCDVRTTIYDDYEKTDKVGLYKGRYPLHENEAAISATLSSVLKKGEGDFITLKNELQDNSNLGEYVITGITQGSYTGGMDVSLTFDGIKQIDKNAKWQTVYVYTFDDGDIYKTINDIKQVCGKKIVYIDNFQNVFNKQFESVTKNISDLVLWVLILSICIISVIVFLVAQTILLNNTYMFGVLKAVGFTTAQIMYQIVMSMFPIVMLGSFIGYLLSNVFTNTITTMMLNRMGVYKVDFSSPDSYILGFVVLICTVSYMVSILALWKLKNETPVNIIRQKE